MRATIVAIVLAFWMAGNLQGGEIALIGDDAVWPSLSGTSPDYFFKVKSDTGLEEMWAWQLKLQVAPQADAVGTVGFKSAGEPPDYLFADNSLGIYPTTFPESDVLGPIMDASFPGEIVPSVFTNLLQVTFEVSPGAQGRFDILALPGEHNTMWVSDDFDVTHYFANIPFEGSPAFIGSVTIGAAAAPTPEPSCLGLAAVGAAAVLLRGWRTKRRFEWRQVT